MTEKRKLLLLLREELFSLGIDGYNIQSRNDFGDELVYCLKHRDGERTMKLVLNFKFQFIKFYKNGKWRKTIEV